MNAANWITLITSALLQIVAIIIVLWQFNIKSTRRLAERESQWEARLEGHDEKIKSAEKAMEQMSSHIKQLEDQFNHRFTDYKNEVISLIRELKANEEKTLVKMDAHLSSLDKKISSIFIDMAFLKGERYREGKSKFPSQSNQIKSDETES